MSETNANSYLERQMAAQRKKKTIKIVQYTLAIIVTLIVMFPLYWMLSSSVKSQEEILLLKPTLWPHEIHLENYTNVFNRVNFGKYYYNTIVMTAGILISQIVTGVLRPMVFLRASLRGRICAL